MKFSTVVLIIAFSQAAHSMAATPQSDASAQQWLKYYSQHLPEAKKMLQQCVARGFDKIQGEEKTKCEAARDAWHFQPYRPSRK